MPPGSPCLTGSHLHTPALFAATAPCRPRALQMTAPYARHAPLGPAGSSPLATRRHHHHPATGGPLQVRLPGGRPRPAKDTNARRPGSDGHSAQLLLPREGACIPCAYHVHGARTQRARSAHAARMRHARGTRGTHSACALRARRVRAACKRGARRVRAARRAACRRGRPDRLRVRHPAPP